MKYLSSSQLTPQERWDRIGEILVRAIYRYEEHRKALEAGQVIKQDRAYTVSESAEILEVSKRTIKRGIAKLKIKAERKPNGYLFIRSDELARIRKSKELKGVVYKRPLPDYAKAIKEPELSHEGVILEKKKENGKCFLECRCPNDKKKLAELPDDYFDTPDGRFFMRNKRKCFMKCSRCKQIIEF